MAAHHNITNHNRIVESPSPRYKMSYTSAIATLLISVYSLSLSSAFTTNCYSLSSRAGKEQHQQFLPLEATTDEERDYISPMRNRPKPKGGDVAYNNENILRQTNNFVNIRKVGGSDCVLDIYAKDHNSMLEAGKNATRFWFVAKVARCTGEI